MTRAVNDATLQKAGDIYQYLIALRDCFELNDGDTPAEKWQVPSLVHHTNSPQHLLPKVPSCHFSAGGPFSFLGFFRLFGCVAETRQDDSGFSENKENEERKDADGCIGHLFAFGRQGSD